MKCRKDIRHLDRIPKSSKWKRKKTKNLGIFTYNNYLIAGVILAVIMLTIIIVGFFWTPYNPNNMELGKQLSPPSPEHLLGCDNMGRDILSRIMIGSKSTLIVGIAVVIIGLFFGLIFGSITGYYGGWLDKVLMRFNDAMTSFPAILSAIIFVSIFGSGKYKVIIILGVVFIPGFVRMVRGEVLKLKNKEFVQLSKLVGAGDFRIICIHILPNTIPAILSTVAIAFNNAVLAEATLSFLGIGIKPPDPSLGRMLSESQSYIFLAPWYCISAGLTIVLLILSFGLISEGITRGKKNVRYSKFIH